jgi:hypothetical protein
MMSERPVKTFDLGRDLVSVPAGGTISCNYDGLSLDGDCCCGRHHARR